ncbi:SMI1/KNR4 family protein [Streptomyces fructofermentans]|uniref:SMI1/KNR4 family protein n=1 Tax=Streptomyces fructofermentans TaxID=152141 RepID=UPI0033C8A24F
MTSSFDLVSQLTPGLADSAEAWTFIRGFAAHWVTPLAENGGCDEAELASAETRLGLTMPAALREGYRLIGRRPDLTSNHDHLLSPTQLYIDDRGEALVFRHENQGAASWGVLLADLDKADPPVVMKSDLADKAAEHWEGWMDRCSLAWVEIVMSESLHEPEELSDFLPDLDEPLDSRFALLPCPSYPGGSTEWGRWFAGPDVILREEGGECLSVRARTQEVLNQIRDALPGGWVNDYR